MNHQEAVLQAWALSAAKSAAAMIAGSSDRMDTAAMAKSFVETARRGGGWVGHWGVHLTLLEGGGERLTIPEQSIWRSNR